MNQDAFSTNLPESTTPASVPLTANRERSERVSSDDPHFPDNRERSERVSSDDTPTGPTGPRTPAGKLRSSINAIKHGLRAAKTENAVPPEMRRTYEKLRAQYLDEYRPSGATESTLLDMVILAAWQLYRIREMELFAPIELASPLSNSSFGKSDRLARYRAGYERMFHTNLKQLNQIQQERLLLAADRAARLPVHIPPGVRLKPIFNLLDTVTCRPKARTATYRAESAASLDPQPTPIAPSIRP